VLVHIAFFYIILHAGEYYADYEREKGEESKPKVYWLLLVVCVFDAIILLREAFVMIRQTAQHAAKMKNGNSLSMDKILWSIYNVLYVALGIAFIILMLCRDRYHERNLASLLTCINWVRLTYYMGLVDSIAPFLQIVGATFSGVNTFMVLLVVVMYALANSFFILGQNQLEFDDIEVDNYPDYAINML